MDALPWELLLGPLAALVLAILGLVFFAKIGLDYINHLKAQVKELTSALAAQAAATNRVADLLEDERKEKAWRQRLQDGKG